MGWDGVKLERGETAVDFVRKDIEAAGNEVAYLAANEDAVYVAVKLSDDTCFARDLAKGTVSGLVVAIQRGRDGYTMFKWMGEQCGPYYHNAPRKLIEMLSPLPADDKSYAAQWRQNCLAHA